MIHFRDGLHYRVVGVNADGTRDPRYCDLSFRTAEWVRHAMLQARAYERVVIEDQRKAKRKNG